jgi:hypothetical protein
LPSPNASSKRKLFMLSIKHHYSIFLFHLKKN